MAGKKETAKKDVKGKGKAVETEKPKETEKQPNKGKGKQKVEVEVNAADEEPAAPQAKRRKTTKTAPASKTGTTTRMAKRSSPGEYFFHFGNSGVEDREDGYHGCRLLLQPYTPHVVGLAPGGQPERRFSLASHSRCIGARNRTQGQTCLSKRARSDERAPRLLFPRLPSAF